MSVKDPDYDYIEPLPKPAKAKKGSQCGECGKKFDYGVYHSHCCPRKCCPMGFGPWSSWVKV